MQIKIHGSSKLRLNTKKKTFCHSKLDLESQDFDKKEIPNQVWNDEYR